MDRSLQICIVGDRRVGKTSLINKFVKDDYATECEKPEKLMAIENQIWNLEFTDCPLNVCCCVLVFDLTERASFVNLTNHFDHFNTVVHPHPYKFKYVVIGNKTDKLRDRAVSKEEAIDWCYSHKDVFYFETSAADGSNVVDAFEQIARCAILYIPYARGPLYHLQGDYGTVHEEIKDFLEASDKCFNMYNPQMKIEKLLFLAKHGVNQTASLKAACRLIKLGDNHGLLKTVRKTYKMKDEDDDHMWLERARERFESTELKYRSQMEFWEPGKRLETKRIVHSKLGQLYYDVGDFQHALDNYLKELEVCTMKKQIVDSHLKVILVCLKMRKLEDVVKRVDKIRLLGLVPKESIVATKVTCASALGHMGLLSYNKAADEFLSVDTAGLGTLLDEVILPRDVSIFGGLCALASYDRSKIQQKVLDNDHAWRVLGQAPEIRNIIEEFHRGHYAYCLKYLHSIKAILLWDIYFHNHVEGLFDQIRKKALLEYAQSYVSLSIHTMALEFNSSVSDLEKELNALIADNKLQAHIDFKEKVLKRKRSER